MLPLPGRQLAGNAPLRWYPIDIDYPMLAGEPHVATYPGLLRAVRSVIAPSAILPVGCWSVQAVLIRGRWWPCYFAAHFKLFGFGVQVFGPLRPNLTPGEWGWTFDVFLHVTR